MNKSLLWVICRIGIAAGVIGWILFKQPLDIAQMIESVDIKWLLLAILFYFVHQLTGAVRWFLLLKVLKIDITLFESLSLFFQGLFFSLIIPGGAIGGDLVKANCLIARTPSGSRLEGTFTILMDRIIGMIALFSLAGVVAFISHELFNKLDGILEVMVYALIVGCFSGLAAIIVIFFHRQLEKIKPIGKLMKLVDKFSKGALSRLAGALDLYRTSYKTVILCIVMSVIFIHINAAMVLCFISYGVGENVPPKTVLAAITAGNTAGLIPLTPGGFGTRDAVINGILEAGGVDKSKAVLIALLYTAIILLFSLVGGLFFVFDRKNKIPNRNSDDIK